MCKGFLSFRSVGALEVFCEGLNKGNSSSVVLENDDELSLSLEEPEFAPAVATSSDEDKAKRGFLTGIFAPLDLRLLAGGADNCEPRRFFVISLLPKWLELQLLLLLPTPALADVSW